MINVSAIFIGTIVQVLKGLKQFNHVQGQIFEHKKQGNIKHKKQGNIKHKKHGNIKHKT